MIRDKKNALKQYTFKVDSLIGQLKL